MDPAWLYNWIKAKPYTGACVLGAQGGAVWYGLHEDTLDEVVGHPRFIGVFDPKTVTMADVEAAL